MSQKVIDYLGQHGRDKDVLIFEDSSATVELAAQVLGVEPARIAKTLAFQGMNNETILIVAAGDIKVDNQKFRTEYNCKCKMLRNDVEKITGYPPGGVCPFENPPNCKVYCDVSLKRFQTIFPSCGTSNSAIELNTDDLFKYSKSIKWVDVAK